MQLINRIIFAKLCRVLTLFQPVLRLCAYSRIYSSLAPCEGASSISLILQIRKLRPAESSWPKVRKVVNDGAGMPTPGMGLQRFHLRHCVSSSGALFLGPGPVLGVAYLSECPGTSESSWAPSSLAHRCQRWAPADLSVKYLRIFVFTPLLVPLPLPVRMLPAAQHTASRLTCFLLILFPPHCLPLAPMSW